MGTTMKPKQPMEFDQAKLQNMTEPITVRVQKMRGNQPSGIEIPGKGEGAAPGTNWSREEVLRLENWLLTEWSGGGFYRFSVTDANGETMRWESAFDPRVYPEKVPPNAMSAAQIPNPQILPAGVPVNPQLQIQTPSAQAIPSQGVPFGMNSSSWPPPAATFGYGSQVVVGPQQQPQQQQPVFQQQMPMQYGWPYATPYSPYGMPGMSGMAPAPATPVRDRGDRDRWLEMQLRERDRDRETEREERQRQTEREAERLRYQEELRRKDDELRARELAQREAEHKAGLERQQQQHAAEMAKMVDEIRRLGEQGRDKENDEVRRAREEQARLQRERERDQINQQFQTVNQQFQTFQQSIAQTLTKVTETPREDPKLRTLEVEIQKAREDARMQAEQQQRERDRWESQRQQEALVQQMREQENRTALALKEATATRSDPMVEYMKESARLSQEQSRMQSENMREIARMQQASQDRMAAQMMNPQQLASIIRDSGSGTDMLMKNVVETFSGIFGTMRSAIEQVAQLTGGAPEPPAVRIVEQGIQKAGAMAERYFGMKAQQQQNEAQVAAARLHGEAQVRAAAYQAQAAAATAAAQQNRPVEFAAASTARKTNGQSGPEKAAAQPSSGLGGAAPVAATPPPPVVRPPKPGKPAAPTPPTDLDDGLSDPVTGQTLPAAKPVAKRAGKTDEEWFGAALESVTHLRTGVKTFLSNLAKIQTGEEEGVLDEEGNVVGLEPNAAIDAILKGINYVSVNGMVIPAFEELFKQGRYAEFLDVLLPGAHQGYKDDCVKILTEEVDVTPPSDVIDVEGVEITDQSAEA
jgi:hypothetical protein